MSKIYFVEGFSKEEVSLCFFALSVLEPDLNSQGSKTQGQEEISLFEGFSPFVSF